MELSHTGKIGRARHIWKAKACRTSCLVGECLLTELFENGRRRLMRDLEVETDGQRFVVPAGAETDSDSIPSFERFIGRWSKVDIAGVVHDWLYLFGWVAWYGHRSRHWAGSRLGVGSSRRAA